MYGVSCKKNTENKNSSVCGIKSNKLMLISVLLVVRKNPGSLKIKK